MKGTSAVPATLNGAAGYVVGNIWVGQNSGNANDGHAVINNSTVTVDGTGASDRGGIGMGHYGTNGATYTLDINSSSLTVGQAGSGGNIEVGSGGAGSSGSNNTSNSTMTVNNTSINAAGRYLEVGARAIGTVNLQNNSSLTAGNAWVGDNAGTGVVNVNSGSTLAVNELDISQDSSTGVINIDDATLTTGSHVRIGRYGGTGTPNIDGGLYQHLHATNDIWVADQSTGTINLIDGTFLQKGGNTTKLYLGIGGANDGNATANIYGGEMKLRAQIEFGSNAKLVLHNQNQGSLIIRSYTPAGGVATNTWMSNAIGSLIEGPGGDVEPSHFDITFHNNLYYSDFAFPSYEMTYNFPEPGTLLFLSLGALPMLRRRR